MVTSLYMRKNMLCIDWQVMKSLDAKEIQTVWCADPFNMNLSCLVDLVVVICACKELTSS